MGDSIRIEVKSSEHLLQVLNRVADEFPKVASRAIWDECDRVMTISKTEYCPEDSGMLKNSGKVSPVVITDDAINVTMGYYTDYAWYVHEIPPPMSMQAGKNLKEFKRDMRAKKAYGRETGEPLDTAIKQKRTAYHDPPTQWKYLETPVRENADKMIENVIKKCARVFRDAPETVPEAGPGPEETAAQAPEVEWDGGNDVADA
jgi:hypothetical protein